MKLKYLVKYDDHFLFANSLDDLASYYNITLAGVRYRMKNKLINITKINNKLQHLKFDYTIDKHGIVTVMKTDFINTDQDNQTKSSTFNHLRKCDVNDNEPIINNNNI